MFIESKDISLDTKTVWNKTKQLKLLKEAWYNVPDFIALPTDTVSACATNKETLIECCNIIRETFPKQLYAVRSSALTEDGSVSSMAGQFETKVWVKDDSLEEAILEIILDAQNKLTNLSLFSIIIQEYIELEYSGVCFTRNPNWGREMIIESHRWRGENLVGGEIIPTQERFYHGKQTSIYGQSTEVFEHIEKYYDFPQDIEWGIKNGELFILQTRPITTLTREKYNEIQFLENTLPKNHDFFYEKTEISEMAARPTPFTFSLLEKIYGENGPVMNTYKKYWIRFLVQSFLILIGNELYADHNCETKTLLPSYSWNRISSAPKFTTLRWAWTTINNLIRLIFLRKNPATIYQLKNLLEKKIITTDFSENLNNFLVAYETVFEINLFAARALKKLEILIKKEPVDITDILGWCPFLQRKGIDIQADTLWELLWNTLEISDTEPLYKWIHGKNENDKTVSWWQNIPLWKKNLYEKPISEAIAYQEYREYARILMVKYMNHLRKSLQNISWETIEEVYFRTIPEIEEETYDKKLCEERKNIYTNGQKYHLPSILSSDVPKSASSKGLSAGQARGTIVISENITSTPRPRILWTKILSPELTQYFDEIDGIITENGWLLSHLAIIARERKIPVVVTNTPNFRMNDVREIDGTTGEIKSV